jgi:hypothetical protein
MKNKKILLGSVAVAMVASVAFVNSPKDEGVYHLRQTNESSATIDGAFDFYSKVRSNIETGTINHEDWLRAYNDYVISSADRAAISWAEHGPSNIGGRTRAILIDKNNDDHVFAGSVTGGLYESHSGGNQWFRVPGFNGNLSISSMCMTDNGDIFVATGHSAEIPPSTNATNQHSGAMGGGLYKSTNGGSTFSLISGTETYTYINEVVSKGNDVLIATDQGLKKVSGATVSAFGPSATDCKALSIQGDVIVANFGLETYVSTNGGAAFTQVSGTGSSQIPSLEVGGRIEYAISDVKQNGSYYVYAIASKADGFMKGIYKSTNNGNNWSLIAPESTGVLGQFSPLYGMGNYAMAITVVPGDAEAVFVGGINLYYNSTTANWEPRSNFSVPKSVPIYLHEDQHELVWDSNGKLYIGNDGGVTYSLNGGNTFVEANRDYNVTQFYALDYSSHGDVIGGTQDNGSLYNYHNNYSYKDFRQALTGDGYKSAMSKINRDIFFVTTAKSQIYRTGSAGGQLSAFNAKPLQAQNHHADFTQIELYENPNDLNSRDYVLFYKYDQTIPAGTDTVIKSLTTGGEIEFTVPYELLFEDSVAYNPSLTTQDTLLYKDTLLNAYINLTFFDSTLYFKDASQAPTYDVGDTLIYYLDDDEPDYVTPDLVDTFEFVVQKIEFIDHYWADTPLRPGKILDLANNTFLYDVRWDTVSVQDVYQSWFAGTTNNSSGISQVFLSREAIRLSVENNGFYFIKALDGINGIVTDLEFSADGDHLFISTDVGELWRISGLADIYTSDLIYRYQEDTNLFFDNGHVKTTTTLINDFNQFVTSISCDRQDPDHIVVTLGQFGGTVDRIQESTNATGAAPTFTGIDNLPFTQKVPVYSSVINWNNPNIIFVGTDMGVYQTTNGGTTWENVSGDFGNVPVFDMKQAWRTWAEGEHHQGRLYIATHGRGIWSSDEYLTISEQDNLSTEKFAAKLIMYPNPVSTLGTLQFDLTSQSDVNIQIYDLNGKLVQNMTKNNMVKGANTINIETAELTNGTYIVRLTAGDMIKTTKFIKQ